MSNRNKTRNHIYVDDSMYQKHLEDRSLKRGQRQYSTGKFYYPTKEELSEISIIDETWSLGDRLYKYAKKYYNNEEYWWLIAWFNKKPTEHHFKIGEKIRIIANLSDAKRLYYGE